jgi:hypothetical protein
MATAATSLLGLALPVTGELSGTWGDTVNNSITSLVDSAIAGTTTLSSDADVTLTTTTLAANQAREAIILWTASGTVTRNITAPAQSKAYIVINATGSTQSIVLRGAGPTTGVTLVAGEKALCSWNGSDFVKIATTATASSFSAGTTGLTPSTATTGAITLAGTLGTANGGTNLTSFTSGGALYATSTSALTTGTLPTASGGTNLTSFTSGGALYATSTSVLATGTLPNTAGGTGQSSAFTQYGITYASTTSALATTSAGTSSTLLHGNASGAPTFGAVALATEVSGQLPIANGGTGATTLAGANIPVTNVANTFTATQTFNGTTATSAVKTLNIAEPANVVASAPSATTNFYVNSGAVQYYTTNAANNWTLNIAFSSGTSLNTAMATNDSISITMLATQGSTAYYNSAVTIDGTSVTPKWQGGSAPTSGNASGIDSYTYVVLKTASATYTVLASQTKFA